MDRRECNARLKGQWKDKVRKWSDKRDNVKYDYQKLRWTKLKMPMMKKALQKPLLADFVMQGSKSNDDNEDDNDAHPLMSDDNGHDMIRTFLIRKIIHLT